MSLTLYPVDTAFVAEIGDVDLAKPLSKEDEGEIKAAFAKYAVLVFPQQELSPEEHVEFAKTFGELEISKQIARRGGNGKLRLREDLADTSNLDHENRVFPEESRQRRDRLANLLWHSDSSFKHVPAYASLLYARSVAPIGGHTEFADMRAAWNALPIEMRKRVEDMKVEHWYLHSRAKMGFKDFSEEELAVLPPVHQVLVRTLPDTGRRSLYLSAHAGRIVGLPDAESESLLAELTAHATKRQFVYTHRWRLHDLVMWDNRCTMHRGTAFDDTRWKRDIQRATVRDVANTWEAEAQIRCRAWNEVQPAGQTTK